MKRTFRKLLAGALTLALLCTLLPAAFATEELDTEFTAEAAELCEDSETDENSSDTITQEEAARIAAELAQSEDDLGKYTIGDDGEIIFGPYEFTYTGDNDFGDGASLFDEWDDSWTCYKDQLTGNVLAVYEVCEEAFENGTVYYDQDSDGDYWGITNVAFYKGSMTSDEIKAVIKAGLYAYTYDHPELFWARAWGYMTRNGYVIPYLNVEDAYISNGKLNVEELQNEINENVESILAACADAPVVVRLAYFDQWLAVNNKYSGTASSLHYTNYCSTYNNNYPWTIVGSLTDVAQPVCEGYAKAFAVLCHEIGVPCILVTSDTHMWNMVQLDGQWYYVDPTWDDPNKDEASYTYSRRSYFLISEDTLKGLDSSSSHEITLSFTLPNASSDYFASTEGFTLEDSEITGYVSCYSSKTSSYSYYIALYDANGKFLELQPCISFQWTTSSTSRVLAPTFTNISSASSGKLFAVADDTSWTPAAAAETIEQAS